MVISDNAKTFCCVAQKMYLTFGSQSPQWKFATPRAPWQSGFIERLVRSIKSGLKKSVGISNLTKTQLETELCWVEYSINSRPMTKSHDSVPLRPLDLLLPYGEVDNVEGKGEPSEQTLRNYQYTINKEVNNLAAKWQDHYISNLPMVVSNHFSKGNLGVGDIVLINDNDASIKNSRLLWPLGRIIELIPGRDNKVRSVVLKTATNTITRPIQRLVKLELSPHDFAEQLETTHGRRL